MGARECGIAACGTSSRVAARAAASMAAAILALSFSCSTAPKPAEAVFDTKNKAAEFAKLGDQYMAEGRFAAALGYYEEALSAGSSVDDLGGIAASRVSMGRAYAAAGQPEDARREYVAALEYALMAGSAAGQSAAKAGIGELEYAEGRIGAALGLFEEAAALASAAEDGGKARAVALHDRAVAKSALGDAAGARADLAEAESINRRAKRWAELASNRYVTASILASEGDLELALTAAKDALEADKKGENSRGIVSDLAACARLSARLGRGEDAWGYWRRSFESGLAVDDEAAVRGALAALVGLSDGLGKAAEGRRYAAMLASLDEAAQAKDAAD